ncbi:MAG: CBS domain-containing protein [Planctomycetales bacterium]|nr:CBS domain-containing protein [Planctomycetales bacterium]
MITCPFCGAEAIPGADVCDNCQHSLTDLNVFEPESAVERALLNDRIESLSPKQPSTVAPQDRIGDVLKKMVAESIGCVMVVDGEKLLGIFSERDVLMRVNVAAASMADKPISTVMTERPETLRTRDKIAFALHKMNLGGYRHVPILDGGRLVGVISIRDILNYLTERGAAKA